MKTKISKVEVDPIAVDGFEKVYKFILTTMPSEKLLSALKGDPLVLDMISKMSVTKDMPSREMNVRVYPNKLWIGVPVDRGVFMHQPQKFSFSVTYDPRLKAYSFSLLLRSNFIEEFIARSLVNGAIRPSDMNEFRNSVSKAIFINGKPKGNHLGYLVKLLGISVHDIFADIDNINEEFDLQALNTFNRFYSFFELGSPLEAAIDIRWTRFELCQDMRIKDISVQWENIVSWAVHHLSKKVVPPRLITARLGPHSGYEVTSVERRSVAKPETVLMKIKELGFKSVKSYKTFHKNRSFAAYFFYGDNERNTPIQSVIQIYPFTNYSDSSWNILRFEVRPSPKLFYANGIFGSVGGAPPSKLFGLLKQFLLPIPDLEDLHTFVPVKNWLFTELCKVLKFSKIQQINLRKEEDVVTKRINKRLLEYSNIFSCFPGKEGSTFRLRSEVASSLNSEILCLQPRYVSVVESFRHGREQGHLDERRAVAFEMSEGISLDDIKLPYLIKKYPNLSWANPAKERTFQRRIKKWKTELSCFLEDSVRASIEYQRISQK